MMKRLWPAARIRRILPDRASSTRPKSQRWRRNRPWHRSQSPIRVQIEGARTDTGW